MAGQEVDRFTELLCSRLCHDLISPLGAINNGVELVSEGDTAVLQDAISLIGSSARKAAGRLAYFRLAFGAWGAEPVSTFRAIRKTVEQQFDDKRCAVSWIDPTPSDDVPLEKDAAKLLLNLLLVAGECAQRDATIDVSLALPDRRPRLSVAVRGERCKLRDDVRTGFADALAQDALTVRNIIAQHCTRLCAGMALSLAVVENGPNAVEFKVS